MTLAERADAYAAAFPDWPPLQVTGRWIHGVWIIGNNYRSRSGYYGEYPATYLRRVGSMFPDSSATLHVFSGSVAPLPGTVCVDVQPATRPSVVADATALPFAPATFDLVYADPPYTPSDAARYGTPMVDRRRSLRELAQVTRPGGHLVWLDTVVPMFRKVEWSWIGVIGIIRSTNHRVRACMIFERGGN
jgi:SAM-dependent methyltransferase